MDIYEFYNQNRASGILFLNSYISTKELAFTSVHGGIALIFFDTLFDNNPAAFKGMGLGTYEIQLI
jgi:hypothetical protein